MFYMLKRGIYIYCLRFKTTQSSKNKLFIIKELVEKFKGQLVV